MERSVLAGGSRFGRRGAGWLIAAVVLGLGCRSVVAQSSAWVVRPEWVRAHEEFLASDVLAGRGSATRDEQLAATYVASEFVGYGLKPAPGMTGYLQEAEISAPTLNGHAVLRRGGVKLEEGKGLRLLYSTGESVRGPVVAVDGAKPVPTEMPKGAVWLVAGRLDLKTLVEVLRAGRRAGASALVVVDGDGPRALSGEWGEGTRVPKLLAQAQPSGSPSLLAVSDAAWGAVKAQGAGAALDLEVHAVPQGKPMRTFNAVGYLPGADGAAGTILLTAHLDHLGIGKAVKGDAIYNGANDDASGTTAVLELAHALAAGPKLRRSVLFVCYGSEEAGELGSEYFGLHSPVPLMEVVANLEFEMIGTQDPKMPKDTLLLTGWERSNLGPTLKEHGARLGPDPYPEQHFFERSDNYQLALQGVVAHTAAGYGTPATYHQPDDDLAHLDLRFMTTVIESLVEPVRWLAESDFKPAWNVHGQPKR